MKRVNTITASIDQETKEIFEHLIEESKLSKSGVVREALHFYAKNRDIFKKTGGEKIKIYIEMLSSGEHIILDRDHWILFLNTLEGSDKADEFWKVHSEIARSHAEQFGRNTTSIEGFLRRLEICNFFKLSKTSEKEFTLILDMETSKKFIKILLEEVLSKMDLKVKISEDYSKLRIA